MTKIDELRQLTKEELAQAVEIYYSTTEFLRENNFPSRNPNYSSIINNKLANYKLTWKPRKEIKEVKCLICSKVFSTQVNIKKQRKTCSDVCAKELTALSTRKIKNKCLNCGDLTKNIKYCSNKCQTIYQRNSYIDRWKRGLEKGYTGRTKSISKYIRRYLLEKYNNSCSKCGWNDKHPKDDLPLVEINHIDGNAENCSEDNLEVLCPNCHSKTLNFRNRNKIPSTRIR